MPDFADDQSLISRLRRRIGSVGAATAALLAQYSLADAGPSANPLINSTRAVSIAADKRSLSPPVIAPLVLKPSTGGAHISLAGHRSHSSHSSHRSHVSGSSSSHSSHYSSSVSAATIRPSPAPRRPTLTRSRTVTVDPQVEQAEEVEPEQPPKKPITKPVPEPAAEIDFNDPAQRFKILSFAGGVGMTRATIEDLKENERKRVKEGDTLSGFKILRINLTDKIVEIRGDKQKSVTLKWRGH